MKASKYSNTAALIKFGLALNLIVISLQNVMCQNLPKCSDYFCTVKTNLVVNGDFEQGNTGFTSIYNYSSNEKLSPTKYTITTNPGNVNGSWAANMKDHTSGNGKMLAFDGTGSSVVWEQDIIVSPNTMYNFSAWAASMGIGASDNNRARLQFSINGVLFGSIHQCGAPAQWANFMATWNSGSNTTAKIQIADLEPAAAGNDFVLDDITFTNVCPYPKLDFIVINGCTKPSEIDAFIKWNSPVEYKLNNQPYQVDSVFKNITAGTYTLTAKVDNVCLVDTIIKVIDLVKIKSTVETPQSYCKGDMVTLTSKDANCSTIKWFDDELSSTAVNNGCSYSFPLDKDNVCKYFEPTIDGSSHTTGATSVQTWGTDANNQAAFDAQVPLIIDGFSINGDQYWNGCTKFTASITIEKAGVVIAGPISKKLNCDGTAPNDLTGLDLHVPAGTGYVLKVQGGTFRPSEGTATNATGLINFTSSGPFYNIKAKGDLASFCPVRDKICIASSCPCPDTTLKFPSPICSDVEFDLNTLKTATTSPGVWTIVNSPAGGTPATLNGTIFNGNKNGAAGDYTFMYTLTGGPFPNCAVTNTRTIKVNTKETAKITRNQGPFCLSDGEQTLKIDAGASAGTWSGTGITDAVAGKFDPVVAGVGPHLINYKTSGVCFVEDTITIVVVAQKFADIVIPDTTVCNNASTFKIRTSANTTAGGTWLSVPAGLVNTTGIIDPTKGNAGNTYKVYYLIQGATLACSAADSVNITINAIDVANITPNQGPFCIADPAAQLQLDANAHTGAWSGNGVSATGMFTPQTAGAGKTVITYTTDGACKIVDTVQILVHAKKIANILTADTTVCKNSANFNLRLSANTSKGGMWLENLAPVTSTFNPTTATVSDHRIYYAVQGFNLACSALDSVLVKVNPNADASITTPSKAIFCPEDEAIILVPTITPATGVWWSVPAGGISATGEYNPALAQTGITTVYYGIAGMCGDTSFVQLKKSTIPVFDLGNDIVLCEGQSTQIGTSTIADQTLWNNNTTEPFMNVSSSGEYILTLTNMPNCVFRDTINIKVFPIPMIELGEDVTLCFEDKKEYIIDAQNNTCKYLWSTGDTTVSIAVDKEGLYSVSAYYEGSSNCTTSDQIKIVDFCPYSIYFPNAFTPNGDGINDKFPTPYHNLRDYHLMIFNRWGELIYESYSESNQWDGTYEGSIVQEDVYVWKCIYKVEEEKNEIVKKTQIGRVTVIR